MSHRYPTRRCRNYGVRYGNELLCDCAGYADYNSTEDDYFSDSEGFQSSSESDASSTSNVSEQPPPMAVTDFPSVADLQELLQEQCPEEHAALPDISSFAFEDWNGSKRLRIGTVRTPFDPVRHPVYAFIGGGDNNRTSLTQGSANKCLPLVDAHVVELDEPFWSICWNGRLFRDEEKRRLRALLCYLFLMAGHLRPFKRYRDFEKCLVDVCRWVGGAAKACANANQISPENQQQPQTDLMSLNIHSLSNESSDTDKRKRLPSYERGREDDAERETAHTILLETDDPVASTKRMKLGSTVSHPLTLREAQVRDANKTSSLRCGADTASKARTSMRSSVRWQIWKKVSGHWLNWRPQPPNRPERLRSSRCSCRSRIKMWGWRNREERRRRC